jgi:SAM-dependent methyltransferase
MMGHSEKALIMNTRRSIVTLALSSLLVTGAGLQGQPAEKPADKPYEPQVGQQGKDVVWVPTSDALVEKMLDLGEVTAKDHVIDLGSGDGRTVIAAAKRGARALGVEYNPELVALSRRKAMAAGVAGKATFVKADLYTVDLSKATVITMFLLPEINMKLRPKLLGLKPGTRVVSNSFSMEDWQADQTANVTGEGCESWCTALLWVVPAKVDGTWRLSEGTLVLAQKFQTFTGSLGSKPVAEGRLKGDEISFSVDGARYNGRVNGNSIKGTFVANGTSHTWTAHRAEAARHRQSGV